MKNLTPQKTPFPVYRESLPGCHCHVSTGHTLCVWVTLDDSGRWRSVTGIAWRMQDADRRPN